MTHRMLPALSFAVLAPVFMANQGCETFYESLGLNSLVETACGSSALTPYIGESLVLVPPSLISGSLVRVIRPGDAVTADYNESRLNVSLNAADEIVEVACG